MGQRAELEITGAFASAMQQLSAEAEKTLPEDELTQGDNHADQLGQILEVVSAVPASPIRSASEWSPSRAGEFVMGSDAIHAARPSVR